MRKAHDIDIKNKEAELATLKGKLKVLEQSSGAGAKKISDLKQEYEETVKSMYTTIHIEIAALKAGMSTKCWSDFRIRALTCRRKG